MKNFSSKRALLLSLLSMVICVSMLIGSTFAWFTDSATANVNEIKSGNLDVDLEMLTKDENETEATWKSADGKKLQFLVNGEVPAEGTQILWEPGCTYSLPKLRVVNKGNLALKYTIEITGINGDAKLNKVIDWTINGVTLGNTFASLKANESSEFTIEGHMQETAGNEYRNLSINGIGITVYATQLDYEFDSNGNEYDKDAGTAHYTLDEFNALTEIPEDVKVVYLDIGALSLKDSDVTIGNNSIADVYTGVTGDYYVGQKLDDGRVVTSVWNESKKVYLANTNKPGITLYISGSVNDNNEGGLLSSDPNSITIKIPDASNVVFTKDFTVNGYFRCGFSWNDSQKLGGGVAAHKIQSVLFDHSTFNGIWIQNGGFFADSLTLDSCTFNAYTNKVAPNDSNPLWFCNTGSCDITVKNCSFTASRPIKLAEQGTSGTELTVINNTFDMSVANSANKEGELKNDAIMLCAIGNGSLGNVVISGNKVENGTALMAFYNPAGFTMAADATFKVSDNVLGDGVKLGVVWKTATEYKPDFVK